MFSYLMTRLIDNSISTQLSEVLLTDIWPGSNYAIHNGCDLHVMLVSEYLNLNKKIFSSFSIFWGKRISLTVLLNLIMINFVMVSLLYLLMWWSLSSYLSH